MLKKKYIFLIFLICCFATLSFIYANKLYSESKKKEMIIKNHQSLVFAMGIQFSNCLRNNDEFNAIRAFVTFPKCTNNISCKEFKRNWFNHHLYFFSFEDVELPSKWNEYYKTITCPLLLHNFFVNIKKTEERSKIFLNKINFKNKISIPNTNEIGITYGHILSHPTIDTAIYLIKITTRWGKRPDDYIIDYVRVKRDTNYNWLLN